MADAQDIVDSIMSRLRVDSQLHVQVSIPQVLSFINDAGMDLRNSGWVKILADDESIEFSANDYDYDVPASFAFVHELRIENTTNSPSTYEEIIGQHFWDIREDVAGTPEFSFSTFFPIPSGKKLKVIGQERPSLYTALTDTIDAGMESYIRESALASALAYMAASQPQVEFDRSRFALMQAAQFKAEQMLSRQPMRFRQMPNSRYVPTR